MAHFPASVVSEIAVLRRLIQLATGAPGFAVALCNQPILRRAIFSECAGTVEAVLTGATVDPVQIARSQVPPAHRGAVFITGLERLLSEAHPTAHEHVATLNRSRERWRRAFPAQLLVFWLSEQAAMRLFREAPDFRAWISHELDFTADAAPLMALVLRRDAVVSINSERLRMPPRMEEIVEMIGSCREDPRAIRAARDAVAWYFRDFQIPVQAPEKVPYHWRQLFWANGAFGEAFESVGEISAAREHFTRCQVIARRLITSDPNNTQWLRELAFTFQRLGQLAMHSGDLPPAAQQFREALTIMQKLTERDPGNTQWQRDLAGVLNKHGDLAVRQDDVSGAVQWFGAASDISQRLAESDPHHTEWQRDLFATLHRLSDAAVRLGHLSEAVHFLEKALTIAERLGALDPMHAEWQRDLGISLSRMAELMERLGDLAAAGVWRRRSCEVLDSMQRRGLHLSAQDLDYLRPLWANRSDA
jgi:tetratricopeptide (TPR) repeat protein